MNELNKSKELYEKAKKYIAGGVSSQIRILEHSEVPIFIKKAKGSKIWDVDGNIYILIIFKEWALIFLGILLNF
jgi:glutamate-1-semialdehyde 2,1-aminomutase